MKSEIKQILEAVQSGKMSVEEALLKIKIQPYKDIGFAKLDFHRKVRQGISEVIYGAGKTAEQMISIIDTMKENGEERILITRLSKESAERIAKKHLITYDSIAKLGMIGNKPIPDGMGKILVATGGTSDMEPAEEAALTAEFLGNIVIRIYDVGVAGLHRLLAYKEDIMEASVIIAIAGMEGALASVIAGLADCPVIAVPTSVGYGASFHGISALLSMLNSCASGVSVVNIDNGFGAAYFASMVNHMDRKNNLSCY